MAHNRPYIFSIGEVLFDVFGNQEKLGGAPFNFIIHLHKLGFPTGFLTRIGHDHYGDKIIEYLKQKRFNLDFVQFDDNHPTGRVTVEMQPDGSHRFDILSERAYDYIEYPHDLLEAPSFNPSLIYFGTLAERNTVTRETIYRILELKKNKSIIFLDLNLRAPFFDAIIVEKSLKACDVLKVNDEELDQLKSLIPSLPKEPTSAVEKIIDHYNINIACVTRGAKGSELYYEGEFFKKDLIGKISVVDTVGSGDGFAAILAAGILYGWKGNMILERASEFAAKICGQKGAIPEEDSFHESFSKWFS